MKYSYSNKLKKFVTLVIVSYKSLKTMKPILKKYSKFLKIIIIENSQDKLSKKYIEKKFKNTQVYLKNNIGYGNAINHASAHVKTKYFFAVNPDLKFNLLCLINLLKAAEKLKGNFGGLNPSKQTNSLSDKKKIKLVKSINGSGIFFSNKIFKKIGGFDKKIFLFFEENDYCIRSNRLNYHLYIVNNAFATHDEGKSSDKQSTNYEHNILMTKYWHGQWSRYYFYKKHLGLIKATFIISPKLIKLHFQMFITFFYRPRKSKQYWYQIYGLISSILGLNSFLRPTK